MALLLIAVDAAYRTDSLARFAAKALHGEQQQNLLTNRVGELEAAVIVKRNVDIVSGEADFGLLRSMLRRFIDEIERRADRNGESLQTTVAGAFDFAGQPAAHPDLGRRGPIFGLARDMYGLWLKQLARPEVKSPRREVEVVLEVLLSTA